MNQTEVCLAIAAGDRITKAWIEKTADSGWVMRWDLLKLDGGTTYQNFWGNETMKNIDPLYIEGQFIKSIAIIAPKIRITFSNETSIEFPLAGGDRTS